MIKESDVAYQISGWNEIASINVVKKVGNICDTRQENVLNYNALVPTKGSARGLRKRKKRRAKERGR